MQKDSRLGDLGFFQVRFGAGKHHVGQGKAQDLIGCLKQALGWRILHV
jgi:hypothetical protein